MMIVTSFAPYLLTALIAMPLLKRKDQNKIPPVSDPAPPPSSYSGSYRSPTSTYVASRDGDPYSSSSTPMMSRTSSQTAAYPAQDTYTADRFSRSRGVPDVYARGEANIAVDRNELFSGYNPNKGGSGRFFDGPDVKPPANPGEETEDDIEGIKQQTRFVKQESVNSTRNALRLAREAEDTARNTLTRLGDQSGMLGFLLIFHPTEFVTRRKTRQYRAPLGCFKGTLPPC